MRRRFPSDANAADSVSIGKRLARAGNFARPLRNSVGEDDRVRVVANPDANAADAAMEGYSKGDEGGFAELYDAIAPRLFRFFRKATRDDFAAEDLMQQTLLQMHRARGSFIPGASVAACAFAIERRLETDRLRRSRLERRGVADARGG